MRKNGKILFEYKKLIYNSYEKINKTSYYKN